MGKERSIGLTILGWVFIISNGITLPFLIVSAFNPLAFLDLAIKFFVFTNIFNMTPPLFEQFFIWGLNVYIPLPIPVTAPIQYFSMVSIISVMGILCGRGILNLNRLARIFTIIFNLIFVVFLVASPLFSALFRIKFNAASCCYFASILTHTCYIVYLFLPEAKEQFK